MVPMPLALVVIVALVVGLSPMNTMPVVLASLTSFAIAHGFGVIEGSPKKAVAKTAVSGQR